MAGTQSVQLDELRVLGIPRSRQTVAIIDPNHDGSIGWFPRHLSVWAPMHRGCTSSACGGGQCRARAAQDIEGHHRPAVVSCLRQFWALADPRRSEACTLKRLDSPRSPPRRASHRTARVKVPESPRGTNREPTQQLYICARQATIERQRSRSLSESTRQITPRTRSGHAPPSKGSRKSFQSVNHHSVRPW